MQGKSADQRSDFFLLKDVLLGKSALQRVFLANQRVRAQAEWRCARKISSLAERRFSAKWYYTRSALQRVVSQSANRRFPKGSRCFFQLLVEQQLPANLAVLRRINRVKSGNNGIVMLTQSIFDICNPKCLNIHTVPSCLNSLHFIVSKHRRFYHRISTYQCTKSTFLTLMAWLRSLFLDSSTSSYITFSLACSK